jgi:hypothetical protein
MLSVTDKSRSPRRTPAVAISCTGSRHAVEAKPSPVLRCNICSTEGPRGGRIQENFVGDTFRLNMVFPMPVVVECKYSLRIVVHGEDVLERGSRYLPLPWPVDFMRCRAFVSMVCSTPSACASLTSFVAVHGCARYH